MATKKEMDELQAQLDAEKARADKLQEELDAANEVLAEAGASMEFDLPDGSKTTEALTAVAAWQDQAEKSAGEVRTAIESLEAAVDEHREETESAKAAHEREIAALQEKVASGGGEKLEQATGEMDELRIQLDEAKSTIASMERQMGSLRLSFGEVHPLGYGQVEQMIKADSRARFQVVADYEFMSRSMNRGRVIRASHHPDLLSHVRNGLLLIATD